MKINIQAIPKSLREQGAWCCWRMEDREGKPTKVPYNPMTGGRAMSNNRSTFGTFEQACFAKDMNGYDGIGIGIFGDICAIDIDHCISDDGAFSDMAADIINTMNSYWEISPSGTGIRILFRAPGLQYDKAKYYINKQKIGLEIYAAGFTNKYVTITGNSPGGVGINNRSDQLQEVLDLYMRRDVPQNGISRSEYVPPAVKILYPDVTVIKKASKAKNGELFKKLMSGDYSDYRNPKTGEPDHSSADMALCNILAFWCSGDAEQMDRIYRSSGLMREKWDRKTAGSTYGAITIQDAINRVQHTYSDRVNARKEPMPIKPRRPGGERYGW